MEAITIEHLTFAYPKQERKALEDISISFDESGFYLLCGQSGCGKSTLLRQMKKSLIPYGTKEGAVTYHGVDIEALDERTAASEIGFVSQNPQEQIVTDKVWHELAFGLENLGLANDVIRRRVAEMANFFGIQTWFRQDTSELSGGQLQMVNLASVMVMQPKVLILDEPTSQLDPLAASDFLQMLLRINRELGTTIIICEHHLEELFAMADQVIVMEEGRIELVGAPREIADKLVQSKCTIGESLRPGLPAALRIARDIVAKQEKVSVDSVTEYPITVRDGRLWLAQKMAIYSGGCRTGIENGSNKQKMDVSQKQIPAVSVIELRDVWFRYQRNGKDILRGCNLQVHPQEWFTLLGGNGAGKSTLLSTIINYQKPYRGKVVVQGADVSKRGNQTLGYQKMVMLPQEPKALFMEITVEEELMESLRDMDFSQDEKDKQVEEMLHTMGLQQLRRQHPYDLSGGEQQRLALGKLLLLQPAILLLDEPTKGLDPEYKQILGNVLKKQQQKGMTIFMVSHDVEFTAGYANRCGMFFDGEVIAVTDTRSFFSGNTFYTTAANRMARQWFPEAVTCEEVVKQWEEM